MTHTAASVRWLSESDQRVWRQYLRATLEISEALDRDLVRSHDLSLNEYEVMVVLSESRDHTVRMSALADELVNSRSRLTHTVRRMESRGLVRREACASDGRGVNCILTPEGYRALVEAAPDHVDSVRRNIFDNLTTAEVRQLGEILAKLGESRHA